MTTLKIQPVMRGIAITLAVLLLASVLAQAIATPAIAAPSAAICKNTHIARASDTLESIAKKYGVTLSELAKANGMSTGAKLHKGQSLCIPANSRSESGATYNVQASKGLVTISGSGFTKNSPYLVKVREGDLGMWYTLGRISASKDGTFVPKLFALPKDLQKTINLTVCLKNQITDKLTCRKVYHIP